MGLFDMFSSKKLKSKPVDINQRGADITSAFGKAFPSISGDFASQISPLDDAITSSTLSTFPKLAGLQREESLKDQSANLGLITEDINTLLGMERGANPNIYGAGGLNENIFAGLQDLMKPGLSGGEEVSIERFLNRRGQETGTQYTPSNLDTVARATTFGDAARNRFSQALQQAVASLPSLKQNLPSPMRQIGSLSAPVTQSGAAAQSNIGALLQALSGGQNLAAPTLAPSAFDRGINSAQGLFDLIGSGGGLAMGFGGMGGMGGIPK